jgi:hypothetical protein
LTIMDFKAVVKVTVVYLYQTFINNYYGIGRVSPEIF